MRSVALIGLAALVAGCAEPTARTAYYGGAVTTGDAMGQGSAGKYVTRAGCPAGATLVTIGGKTSCAHVGNAELTTGSESPLDPAVRDRLVAQANATGRPVAYSNGTYSVIVRPAP